MSILRLYKAENLKHMGPSHAALTWHLGWAMTFTGSFLVDEKAYRLFVLRPKGTLKVIFPCGYTKNLETERSAPISCHFLFRQSETKWESKSLGPKTKGPISPIKWGVLSLVLKSGSEHLGLIRKQRLLYFKAYKIGRRMGFKIKS